jgi:hypothetical protein
MAGVCFIFNNNKHMQNFSNPESAVISMKVVIRKKRKRIHETEILSVSSFRLSFMFEFSML